VSCAGGSAGAWAKERLIVFEFPSKHENMPIDGFPVKFELQGGWTIRHSDLKYLTDGPLASEGLHRILVPANLGWQRALEGAKQVAPIFTIIGVFVTIAVSLPRLKAIWQTLTNASSSQHRPRGIPMALLEDSSRVGRARGLGINPLSSIAPPPRPWCHPS